MRRGGWIGLAVFGLAVGGIYVAIEAGEIPIASFDRSPCVAQTVVDALRQEAASDDQAFARVRIAGKTFDQYGPVVTAEPTPLGTQVAYAGRGVVTIEEFGLTDVSEERLSEEQGVVGCSAVATIRFRRTPNTLLNVFYREEGQWRRARFIESTDTVSDRVRYAVQSDDDGVRLISQTSVFARRDWPALGDNAEPAS